MIRAAAPTCIGEPLSWLVLERHALGELPEPEAGRVRAHLAGCLACAACAAEAGQPMPLPAVAAPRTPWWRRYAAAWATTAALAGAAAGFLVLARAPERGRESLVAVGDTLPGVKGGDAALELVRERAGTITHGAATFAPGDRWKVLVTCPAGRLLFWEVTVREGEGRGARAPLAPAEPIACGNHVPLPGAFRLSGSGPAEVCLTLAADPLPLPHDGSRVQTGASGLRLCAPVHPEP